MISKFFIERPVLSNVIAILMVLIGGVCLFRLAVAQYPDVVPPTVQVTTRYPGASAKTVIDTVALPIEQQVNGVEDMLYMQSYSGADGTYSLTVNFKIGTDLNFAQVPSLYVELGHLLKLLLTMEAIHLLSFLQQKFVRW